MRANLKLIAGVVIAIAVVGLLLGVGLTRRLAPQRTLERAAVRLLEAETYRAKANLTLHLPERLGNRERPFRDVVIRIEGDAAKSESGAPELTGQLYGEAKGRGNIFFVDGELRLWEEETAFRLDNLPVLLNRSGSLVNKWTYVEAGLLKTSQPEGVKEALAQVVNKLEYGGEETIDGRRTRHYRLAGWSAEEEDRLAEALNTRAAGSPALNILSRLLSANDLEMLEVWVETGSLEVPRVLMKFVRPTEAGEKQDFAALELAFTDYGQPVSIDRPDKELTVEPAVFAQLFGTGEITQVQSAE